MGRDDTAGSRPKPSLDLFEGCTPAPETIANPDAHPFQPSVDVGPDEVAAVLAAHPDKVHARGERGTTMLIRWAGVAGADLLEVIVAAGADVNARDLRGNAALHAAAFTGNEGGVDLLLAAGARVDVVDGDGFSPLHWAARNGHVGVVRRLLEAGADPRLATPEGAGPLFLAALFGQVETCRVLLAAGAEPFADEGGGVTPFDAGRQGGHAPVLELFLETVQDVFDAIGSGDAGRLRAVLAAHPGRVHAHNELGMRPLHHAALEGTLEDVAALLAAGVDANQRDAGGAHALQMTSQDEVARLLLERGADPDLVVGPWGTLLHLEIVQQRVPRVRLFLEAGADAHAVDPEGRSCLDLARATGNEEMVALLERWLAAHPSERRPE